METNIYLSRAIEAYPYELAKAVEALNFALSYEPNNVKALCLMAKVQSEQFGDYKTAKTYYEHVLAVDINYPDVYPDFIRFLVNGHDFIEAQKLIDFAITIKGIDKAGVQLSQGYLYEALGEFEKAEEALKAAKMFGLNNEFDYFVDEVITRVSKKRKIQNNKNRVKETVEKKEVEKTDNSNWFKNRFNNLL
jgi:tetratricopeptide (TPR) repeat protein